ncbi:hypothetical protein RS9917_11191 [Synechococcus sp. RS9917]|nr:hypothetical protein RS9917_11191 [Synechococcus sp. RS9917]
MAVLKTIWRGARSTMRLMACSVLFWSGDYLTTEALPLKRNSDLRWYGVKLNIFTDECMSNPMIMITMSMRQSMRMNMRTNMRISMTTMRQSMRMNMRMSMTTMETMRQNMGENMRTTTTTTTTIPNMLMRMDQAHHSDAQTSRDFCKRVINPMIDWRCRWPGSLITSQVMKERILALA